MRAWRAFSQWRTSWLSREGVAAVLTYVPALVFAAALLPAMIAGHAQGAPIGFNAMGKLLACVLMALSLATVHCTAMIYASLKPIPAWAHRLVAPGYLLFALLTGGLLLAAIATLDGASLGNAPAMLAVWLAIALWLLKRRYWHDIDVPLPATRGDAVGLPRTQVSVFERPHTEANYLTREMAFVVARTHSRRLRLLAVRAVRRGADPVACCRCGCSCTSMPAPWFALAAMSALAGAFVERWLFFAEAKHMVTLYY